MKKVDMSPEAITRRLRIAGELSEELLRSTFDERYEVLMLEQAELKAIRQKNRKCENELPGDICGQVFKGE